jgi:hypothetical protein
MMKKSLRIVSLLAMLVLVAPSFSGVASELVVDDERDTSLDMQTQEIGSLQELNEYANALSHEFEGSVRGSGSGSPSGGSNELEVLWDTINLDGDDYNVYTYWDHYPSPMPSPPTAHYYLSPHDTHNDDLLRVAIYKGPQSEDNYVQDKSLQEEIITAVEIKGRRAYETERSDMIYDDHSDWAQKKRDDWGLAALDFVDDLFFGADPEMNKRQIITLFLVKALDEKGCSPLSQESYYEAAEWYEDLITFGGNILPGDWVLVADLIDMAVSAYGPVNDYYEFIKGIADGEAHCDLALEALYETFVLLNEIQEVFDDSLEVGLDAIRAIIRGIWEIKIVEKYRNELSIVYDYLPDFPPIGGIPLQNPVKSTINDLINQPTSHLINNFRDAIITEIALWGFDIAGELIATAAMKNPITAAIYIGVGIGLLLAKYLGDNWDKIRGHSHVALTLNTVEWSFRTAINNGNFDAAYNPGTYGLMHLVQNDSTAENLGSFNFAQKIQLKAAADFYAELKSAFSGLNPDWKSESEKEKIKESMKRCQEYHDYRKTRANHSIPWVASSYEDIEALLALTRPVPNLHLDPSNIRVTYPSNPKIGQNFKIETLFENTGDVTIDTTIVRVLMRNKVSPYKWVNLRIGDDMAAAFGFDCGSFMDIISNILGNNPIVQEIFGGSGGGGDNPCTIRVLRRDYKLLDSMTVNYDIEPGAQHYVNFNYLNVNEDDYAGYNNLIVSYRFITGGSEFWDSAVKPIKINRPPNEPRLLSPVNYSGESPAFKFVADDPDGDPLQYTLRLKSADGSIDETYDLSASSYDSGEVVTFNYPGTLNDADYFWWVKASDGVSWDYCDEDEFEVDTVAPVTYHEGDKNEYVSSWLNDWYMGNISLEASDIGSGVDHTNYSLDGGTNWNQTFDTQTSPVVVIDSDGTYDLYYYSVDAAGVREATHYHNSTKVDMTKPSLDYITDYDPSLGPYGWVDYNVSFTLAPTDALVNGSASGVGRLHYIIERNGYYHSDYDDYAYSSPADFTLTDDGLYEIYYYAMDYAYNYNYTTFTVKIDKDPPNTTISNPDGSNGWHKGYPAIISVDEGSGVYQLTYHLVGDRYVEGNETTDDDDYTESVDISDVVTFDQGREIDVVITLDNGFYNVTYHAEDNIGHVELNNTTAIMIDGSRPITFYEISNEPDYYGWYNKAYPNLTIYLNSTDSGPSGFWWKDVCVNSTLGDHLDTCVGDNNVNGTYNIGWSGPIDWIGRIYYKSIDKAGNVENVSYKPIKVDMTPPATSYEILEGHSNDPEDSWVGVSLFSEDFAAGVFYVEYRVNGGSWNRFYNWDGQYSQKNTSFTLYLPDNQMYTIEYRAVDFANNGEAMKTIYLLPDLRVLYGGIWIEGANLYVEVENIGVVDAQDVPVYLYGVIHNPGGGVDEEHLLNSTILPEVRAKKSTVACFLPREYLGAYNIIKVVIDLDNATLPEIRKDNNVATKNIVLLVYQWIVDGIQEIEDSIVIVPQHICKPIIVEEYGKITFKYSDLVFVEPCTFSLADLQRPVPPDVPGIQVNTSGVLELVDSTISTINNIREIIVNIEPNGELLTKGANLIMDAIALIEDLEIPPPETVAPGQPPSIPSIWEIINRMRNAEIAFEPAPPPEFIGEPSFSLNPALDPRSWTVQPAIQSDDIPVSVAEDSYLKLVNVDLMMTPSGAQGTAVTVHSGAKLYLIDSSIGGGSTGTGPACLVGECRLMGGGEIIQAGSEIRDQITYDVHLETLSASRYLYYGETAEYQITVTNNGNTVDTFTLSAETYAQEPAQAGGLSPVGSSRVAGNPFGVSPQTSAWLSWLGTPQVTLNPAQTTNVTLYVQAPPGAGQSNPMEDPDMFRGISVVTATSAGDNEKVSTVMVKTTIADEPSFLKGGNGTNMVYHSTVALGNWTSYDIQIENTDSYVKVLDLYAVDVPDGWAISIDEVTVNVPEGETRTVTVRVRAPFERCMRYELHSRVATIVIIAESDDDEISATITITELPHLNQSPKIHIEPFNRIVDIMENVAFFACRSTDPDGRIMSYRWDFWLDDGHVISAYGGIAEVSFAAQGNYDVILWVIDDNGVEATEDMILEVIDLPGDPGQHGGDNPILGCGCGEQPVLTQNPSIESRTVPSSISDTLSNIRTPNRSPTVPRSRAIE